MVAHHERLAALHARPRTYIGSWRASSAESAMGFSHSTCLPASRHEWSMHVQVIGQRL